MAEADDESFLYGEDGEEGQGGQGEVVASTEVNLDPEPNVDEEESNNLPPQGGDENDENPPGEAEVVPDDDNEAADISRGDNPLEEEDDDNEDDDSDDDDDIQITIDRDKIDEAKTTYQTFGLNKAVRQPPSEKKGKFSVEEFDQVGTIQGTEAQDFDIDSLEDKPWKKPGADITDYFNYGFTEDTWQAYCNRQRQMRMAESGAGMPGMLNSISTKPSLGGSIPTLGVPKRLPTVLNRSMPPPGVLIGESGAQVQSLIPAPIAVMTSDKREFSKKVIETMDFSVPPPGLPPPGHLPPTSMPPPAFEGPPPNPMGDFPAHDPFGQDYDYYPAYEPTMESQWAAPPSAHSGPPPGDAPPGDPTYDDRHGERDVWRDRGSGRRSSREDRDTRERFDRDRERDRKRRRSRSRSRGGAGEPQVQPPQRGERYREPRGERDRGDRERDREPRGGGATEVKRERRSDRRERTKSRSPSSSSRHKKSKKVKREKSDKPDREIKQEKEDE